MLEVLVFTVASAFQADSLRMEIINGKAYVIHQVGEKETLFSISRRYGTTIMAIIEQNPTSDAGLEVGQIIRVPYVPKAKNPAAVQTADGLVHKVAAKETLFSIARLYNVSVDEIMAWNNLKDPSLALGQDIVIKKKPVVNPVETKTVQATGVRTHTVAAKETLFSIARQYGVTWQQLTEWNSLQGTELRIGQVLSVVAPGATIASATPAVKTDATITISEGVSGSDEVKEIGMAELIEGSDGNRKYLAQHRTLKSGTILKIRNLTTNQEVFVRVTGPIPYADAATVIRISKSAHDRLGAVEPKFRAEITYYK